MEENAGQVTQLLKAMRTGDERAAEGTSATRIPGIAPTGEIVHARRESGTHAAADSLDQ